jgi:hypothetical protein
MFRNHQPPSNEILRDLPLVEAPDWIWDRIQSQIASGRAQRSPEGQVHWWRWAAAGVAACLILAVAVYWTASRGGRWEVVRLEGAPSIGSRPIAPRDHFREGQWLETDASSRAEIHVADIGTVRLAPNTRVRLEAARANEQRLALARGRISASVTAPPRLFMVDTAASTAVDLGCAYTMDVDEAGDGLLQVTLGWVSLESHGRDSLVPAGASCPMHSASGPGTPSFDDAPAVLKDALAAFDSGNGAALDAVLESARARDTLTLWNLLSRTGVSERVRVHNRMVELVPLPKSISAQKILELDPETLKHWREELAWKW